MANLAKRSHKDSSDSEKDVKKRRYEESSEEEEDEEHDEEEEVEIDAVRNAENATLPAGPGKWSVEDSHRLLISIMLLLPPCDVEPYSEQEAQIEWEKVAFGSFHADQCREHWRELIKKVRLYRTMSDLVIDALSLLSRPSSSFQMIQKNNRRLNSKPNPKSTKKKSSLPKMVMNAFSFFMKEKLNTLKHIPAMERMKHVSQMYKLLSEAEKNELKERYDEVKRNHIKVLKKLKEDNPALAEEVDIQIKKLEKSPGKPKKPKFSAVNQNNSILKYMNKEKTTPAQKPGGSERKQSNPSSGRSPKESASVKSASTPVKSKAIEDESDQSNDDFTKKSAFKPRTTAAEEEDSGASDSSDNEEQSYTSSARSPKKSAPMKSASRPHKSKAILEKPSVLDHSGSEDEGDQSAGDFRKKLASKPKSTKAVEEEDSSASDSSDNEEKEEKQRPKPPKKSHSAKPAVVSHKKKSVSLTSSKPASKPGNGLKLPKPSSKKKKKTEDVATGLSQFVTTKMASYRSIYPELNDREIAMKLAGKWERLSDKKKNKYVKLALKKMTSEEVD